LQNDELLQLNPGIRDTVVVPDLRGLGLSSKPSGGYDKKTQSRDVTGVMDALGVPPYRCNGDLPTQKNVPQASSPTSALASNYEVRAKPHVLPTANSARYLMGNPRGFPVALTQAKELQGYLLVVSPVEIVLRFDIKPSGARSALPFLILHADSIPEIPLRF